MRTLKRVATSVLCHRYAGVLLGLRYGDAIPHGPYLIEVPRNADPVVKALLYWGVYESAELRFVRQYVGNDLDVIELGSSLGVVACELASRLAESRKLICVEANPALISVLRRNLARNTTHSALHVVHGAIDHRGTPTSSMSTSPDNLVGCIADDSTAGTTVSCLTLAAVLNGFAISDDYLLVSDIEGAEIGIFESESQSLNRCRRLIIELHQTRWQGRVVEVERIIDVVHDRTALRLIDRYGPVCVFDRAASA